MSGADAGTGGGAGRPADGGRAGAGSAAGPNEGSAAGSAAGSSAAPRRLVVGITGASGTVYGVRLLRALAAVPGLETHLVVSAAGQLTRSLETDWTREEVEALADVVWRPTDMAAAISSGSFRTLGMVVAPCSMRTLAEIAGGATTSLVSRAADVTLKERRRLVLVARESPLSLVHLRNMVAVTQAGAIVVPPVPGFYSRPATVEDIVDQTVGRCLDLFDLEAPGWTRPRWGEGGLSR